MEFYLKIPVWIEDENITQEEAAALLDSMVAWAHDQYSSYWRGESKRVSDGVRFGASTIIT